MMRIQGYIVLFISFIMITAIFYLPISFFLKKKGQGFIRQSSYLLCFWSFFLIIFATIILFNLPISFRPKRYILNLQPLKWLSEGNIKRRITTEIRPNVIIFIPLGMFIPIVFKQLRKLYLTAMVVFLITFSIEFFQYFIGRASDIDDIIANLLGGIIGYGVFKTFNYLFKNNLCWVKLIGT